MSVVIKVENLSKQYRLGMVNSGTIKDDIIRWWSLLRGKENPLLKVGEDNDRTFVGKSDYVWSLKDINFDVKQGEVLGIIGKNGAGKSTLLKILSKVTAPTTGVVKSKGRIASLLEVGTGFHPELTGKENIYLNGAILGMRRAEITKKLDEIIEFAGVERYVDTPVKRYSSGMYVRLAFAVAAHLESEILIIDEVLSVGDAEFQKKCLGKMNSISKNEGRTVLFVSHNIQAVAELCTKGLVLENGKTLVYGNIEECIRKYHASTRGGNLDSLALGNRLERTSGKAIFTKIEGVKDGKESWEFDYKDEIKLHFEVVTNEEVENLSVYIALKHVFSNETITNIEQNVSLETLRKGEKIGFEISVDPKTIRPGEYKMYYALGKIGTKEFYDVIDDNVDIPMLFINTSGKDIHENVGFISISHNFKIDA